MTISQAHEQYHALSRDSGYFEAQYPIISETEKAICFNASKSFLQSVVPVWIPKSQMQIVEFEQASDYNRSTHCNNRYFIKIWLYKNFK